MKNGGDEKPIDKKRKPKGRRKEKKKKTKQKKEKRGKSKKAPRGRWGEVCFARDFLCFLRLFAAIPVSCGDRGLFLPLAFDVAVDLGQDQVGGYESDQGRERN